MTWLLIAIAASACVSIVCGGIILREHRRRVRTFHVANRLLGLGQWFEYSADGRRYIPEGRPDIVRK